MSHLKKTAPLAPHLDGHIVEVGEDMKMVVNRFLTSGMTTEEVSEKII